MYVCAGITSVPLKEKEERKRYGRFWNNAQALQLASVLGFESPVSASPVATGCQFYTGLRSITGMRVAVGLHTDRDSKARCEARVAKDFTTQEQ